MKTDRTIISSVVQLAFKWCIPADKQSLKFTQAELCRLIDIKLREQEEVIEKVRRIYKEQEAELELLKSPAFWRFGPMTQAPQDFKIEYMRRIVEKNKV
jgi:hypothetical protein